MKREGFPNASGEELDTWMIRSLLFERKRRLKKIVGTGLADSTAMSAAPLSALMITDQDPQEFLTNSWKWSGPPPDTSSGSSIGGYSDGGGGFDGGGGGAGAD